MGTTAHAGAVAGRGWLLAQSIHWPVWNSSRGAGSLPGGVGARRPGGGCWSMGVSTADAMAVRLLFGPHEFWEVDS